MVNGVTAAIVSVRRVRGQRSRERERVGEGYAGGSNAGHGRGPALEGEERPCDAEHVRGRVQVVRNRVDVRKRAHELIRNEEPSLVDREQRGLVRVRCDRGVVERDLGIRQHRRRGDEAVDDRTQGEVGNRLTVRTHRDAANLALGEHEVVVRRVGQDESDSIAGLRHEIRERKRGEHVTGKRRVRVGVRDLRTGLRPIDGRRDRDRTARGARGERSGQGAENGCLANAGGATKLNQRV